MAPLSKSAAAKATAAAIRKMDKPEKLAAELVPNPGGVAFLSRSVHLPKELKDGTVSVGNKFGLLADLKDDPDDEQDEEAAAVASDGEYVDEGLGNGYDGAAAEDGDGNDGAAGAGDAAAGLIAHADALPPVEDFNQQAVAGDDEAAAGGHYD